MTNAGTYSLHMVVFQALEIPSGKDTQTALDRTKSAISAKIDKRSTTSAPMSSIRTPESDYFKYTPSMQAGPQPGAAERLIKMHNVQNDPLEPPKFHTKSRSTYFVHAAARRQFFAFFQVPRGPGAPSVPVMQSPPRSVDASEQDDWRIPPSISNWKVCF